MDIKLINNNSLNFDPFIQLDHITSHGNEYIDTGVLPTDNIKLEMEFSFNSVSGCPYGTQTTGYTTQSFQLVPYSGSIYYMITLTQGTTTHPTLYTNKRYHVEHKKGIQKLYDTADSSTLLINETKGSGAFSSSKSIYLFAKNSNSGVSSKSSINLYWCKIYNGDTLIRDYVPSYDNYKYCLFDKVTKEYYHNLGGSNFTTNTNLGGSGLSQKITTFFVKDCPEIDCLDVLRRITIAQTGIQTKLTRVRCNIGDVSGTLEELQYYATLSGYSDNYEEQIKPRIIGAFTVSNYHTNAELEALNGLIDELTTISDNNYNIDYLTTNNDLAIQTFFAEASNYNPAVAIILSNNNIGYVHSTTTEVNGGRYLLKKTEVASETSLPVGLFRGITSITDADGIVTSDTTEIYNFEEFNEFKYWTGLTTITAGTGTAATTVGAFGLCTNLESIELPEGLTTIGAYAFYGDTALNRIVIPSTLTTTGNYCFSNCTGMIDVGEVYYNGTLEQWMDITFNATDVTMATSPMGQGSHFYINGEELTQLTIPAGTMQIKNKTFHGFKYLTGNLVIPDTVTSIGTSAFEGCSGFTGELVVPNLVTSLGANAFANTSFTKANLPKTFTSDINIINMFAGNTSIKDITVGSSGTINISGTSCGDGTGTLEIFANVNKTGNKYMGKFKNVIIHGDCNLKSAGSLWNNVNNGITDVFRVQGIMSIGGASGGYSYISNTPYNATHLYYTELGDCSKSGSSGYFMFANNTRSRANNAIVHFNRSTLPTSCPGTNVPIYKVGEGKSRAEDEATLALYLADSTWSTYSAKLGTWYDYNGEYKWYYITDNLTNCTNTNPDAWPHITRGESYETTIVPNEGMTINSLTVEMLDTDTTSPTYDTYIPQPTSYDSATGIYTISIPSVTGNVVITASAS